MKYFYDNILDALLAQRFGVKFGVHLGIRDVAMDYHSHEGQRKYYVLSDSVFHLSPHLNDWVEYQYSDMIYIGKVLVMDTDGWFKITLGRGHHFVPTENIIGVVKRGGNVFPRQLMEA